VHVWLRLRRQHRFVRGRLGAASYKLFAESHSRFLATVAPADVPVFEQLLGGRATRLGIVTKEGAW
jgi:hypothetical protein